VKVFLFLYVVCSFLYSPNLFWRDPWYSPQLITDKHFFSVFFLLTYVTITIYTDDSDWTVTLSDGGGGTGIPMVVHNGRRGRICASEYDDDKSLSSTMCQKLDGGQRFNRGSHKTKGSSMRYVVHKYDVAVEDCVCVGVHVYIHVVAHVCCCACVFKSQWIGV